MAATVIRSNTQALKVVALTDGATININADTVDIGFLTSLSQTSTFANPTGSPTNGQLLQIRITSSASRAISFGTAYQAASSLSLPTTTTGGSVEDYIGFRYSSNQSKWVMIATTIGAGIANTWRQISQNLGTKPKRSGNFTISTTGLTTGRQILIQMATGTGSNADDLEWDAIAANGIATSSTQFTCYWNCSTFVSGTKTFNYLQV